MRKVLSIETVIQKKQDANTLRGCYNLLKGTDMKDKNI